MKNHLNSCTKSASGISIISVYPQSFDMCFAQNLYMYTALFPDPGQIHEAQAIASLIGSIY